MNRLNDKIAVITGAARGIGEAIASAFVEEGAEVLVTDIGEEAGRRTADRLGTVFAALDVREEAHWERVVGGLDREANMAAFVKDTPMRRFGEPAEVAAVAVLLASEEATYMSGAELNIDGGILAGSAAAPEA